jgi:hypothetical protein
MRSAKENFAADIAALKGQLSDVLAVLVVLASAARESEAASFKLKKFLARNDLSESQYHKLRRQKRGPRVMSVGSCGVRISRQAELDWIAARETEAEAAKETDIAALAMQPAPAARTPLTAKPSVAKPLTRTPRGS